MTREPNDPARSGSPLPEAERLFLSRYEVEALSAKAARGAGMGWGLAEEAGIAVGWLQGRGIDALAALLGHLDRVDGRPWGAVAPVIGKGIWHPAGSEALCPIALGATLSDHRDLPEARLNDGALTLGPVGYPILLLPFVADIARHRNAPLSVIWDGGALEIDGDGLPTGPVDPLARLTVAVLRLRMASVAAGRAVMAPPSMCDRQTLARLDEFALRTTVPASARSRADAGAGTGDND